MGNNIEIVKNGFRYDRVLKDLFQRDHPSLLDQLAGGLRVGEFLNVEFPKVIERRADLAVLLEDETILHVEFQSHNDKDIAYREGMYCLMIAQKYRRRVRQVVLYVGQSKMRMADRLDLGCTKVEYRLLDIREIDAGELLRSGRPGDLVLAILAKGGTERLNGDRAASNPVEWRRTEPGANSAHVAVQLARSVGKYENGVEHYGVRRDRHREDRILPR